jgi:hypothetical protein
MYRHMHEYVNVCIYKGMHVYTISTKDDTPNERQ